MNRHLKRLSGAESGECLCVYMVLGDWGREKERRGAMCVIVLLYKSAIASWISASQSKRDSCSSSNSKRRHGFFCVHKTTMHMRHAILNGVQHIQSISALLCWFDWCTLYCCCCCLRRCRCCCQCYYDYDYIHEANQIVASEYLSVFEVDTSGLLRTTPYEIIHLSTYTSTARIRDHPINKAQGGGQKNERMNEWMSERRKNNRQFQKQSTVSFHTGTKYVIH